MLADPGASPLSVNDASPHIMGWPKQPLHYHCACRLTPGHKSPEFGQHLHRNCEFLFISQGQ